MSSNGKELVSIIIRTYNEERYLEELLLAIKEQFTDVFDVEVIVVDSGSSDRTILIAEKYNCRIAHIQKEDFTFGKSLNDGCEFSLGKYLVFISGHCIPVHRRWIANLIKPLLRGQCSYTYGRQLGRDTTKFSERQLFGKYFPPESRVPQVGFFCNNANAAIRREVWAAHRFNEELTGCEDMYLARLLVDSGKKIGYVSDAEVYHIHNETWKQVKIRYEREAIALQQIMPQVQISLLDFLEFIIAGISKDIKKSLKENVFPQEFVSIVCFRFMQYFGAYVGNRNHRVVSQKMKYKYFYPRISDMNITSKID